MKPFQRLFAEEQFTQTVSTGATTVSRPNGAYNYLLAPVKNNGDFRAPTNFSYTSHREDYWHTDAGGFYLQSGSEWYNKGPITKVYGNLAVSADPVPPWDNRDACYNNALDKLNGKVRGNLDLSIDLAEAGTTYRMLKAVSTMFSSLRHPGRVLRRFGDTRDLANGYLSYKYGWKPIVDDIFGAADESLRICINRIQHIKAGKRMPTAREEYFSKSMLNFPALPIRREIRPGSFQGCTIGVSLEMPDDAFAWNHWASLNPVSIAWEVLPYSFVVDWFYNVSGYLRNFETAMLYRTQFRSGYVSEMYRSDWVDRIVGESYSRNASPYKYDLYDSSANCTHVQFQRRQLASYPFPRPPTFTVDLSASKLWSAAALLRQLVK